MMSLRHRVRLSKRGAFSFPGLSDALLDNVAQQNPRNWMVTQVMANGQELLQILATNGMLECFPDSTPVTPGLVIHLPFWGRESDRQRFLAMEESRMFRHIPLAADQHDYVVECGRDCTRAARIASKLLIEHMGMSRQASLSFITKDFAV